MAIGRAGYSASMGEVTEKQSFEVGCPHCHKTFEPEPLEPFEPPDPLGF